MIDDHCYETHCCEMVCFQQIYKNLFHFICLGRLGYLWLLVDLQCFVYDEVTAVFA